MRRIIGRTAIAIWVLTACGLGSVAFVFTSDSRPSELQSDRSVLECACVETDQVDDARPCQCCLRVGRSRLQSDPLPSK